MNRLQAVLILSVCLIAGCMMTPVNGQDVTATGDTVTFSGAWASPGATVQLQRAASPAGPFSTFARATTGGAPITLDGVQGFRWKVASVVPGWVNAGTCAQEVFVRARVGNANLVTFDSARLRSDHRSGLECLFEEVDGGLSLTEALELCVSPDSPVVRLTTAGGSGTHVGDVVIATQADADALSCITQIDGSLTLADDPAALSIALPSLQEVTGDLTIVYSREPVGGFSPAVRSVQLPALTEVGGDVTLSYPGHTSDLVNFDVGLESLATVGGDVSIDITTFNATLSGLDALASLPGSLSIVSHGSDFTVFGLLDALTHVGGDVFARNGLTLLGLLEELETVGGSVRVEDSYMNPGATNLQSLTSVGGDLELVSLSAFVTVDAFGPQLESLASVGGELSIVEAPMFSELLVGDLTGLTVGALELSANGSLSDVSATHIDVATSGAITITNNTTLCQADALAFVAAQTAGGWTGMSTVTGNESCP